MSWETIWKAVLGVIAGFGGVSGIFVIAIKFSSNFIAEKLSKKYELKLNKELENYKYNLENKNTIWKIKTTLARRGLIQNLIYIVNCQKHFLIW